MYMSVQCKAVASFMCVCMYVCMYVYLQCHFYLIRNKLLLYSLVWREQTALTWR